MATLTAEPNLAGNRVPRWVRHPIGLAPASAGLLWLSFPPVKWHGAVWVALVPLFWLVNDPRGGKLNSFAAWLSGFVFWLLAVQWVLAVDPSAWLGWLAMAFALSLFWLAFFWSSRFIRRRLGWPITVVAPVVWVAFEYIRAHVLTGFPWYYLAHSQFRQLYWTQIADLAGSLGVSFLIALVNAAIVEAIVAFDRSPASKSTDPAVRGRRVVPSATWGRLGLVILSLVGTLCYGIYRVEFASFRPGPRVAMLQSGVIQQVDPESRKSAATLQQIYLSLVDKAMARQPHPDLIVWPETAYPFRYVTIDPRLDPADFEEQARRYDAESIAADWTFLRDRVKADLLRILDRTRVPMIIGASVIDFRAPSMARYNSAILLQRGLDPHSYHKLHLVPFGEYVPLIDIFPWLANLMPFPGDHLPSLNFGERPVWFTLGPWRLAAAICFEDTIPHVVRRFFTEVPDDLQPDLIVNLSNEGWFGQTAEHETHLAISTFRCVENRAPMVRAVNTGISALIDGNGRIVQSLAKEVADQVLVAVVPLDDRTSLYSRWGDWLGQMTLAGTIGFVILGWIAPRRFRVDRVDSPRSETENPPESRLTPRFSSPTKFPSLSNVRAWCKFSRVPRGSRGSVAIGSADRDRRCLVQPCSLTLSWKRERWGVGCPQASISPGLAALQFPDLTVRTSHHRLDLFGRGRRWSAVLLT